MIDRAWYLQLAKQKESIQNPYRPPTSALKDRAVHSRDWSAQAIMNTEDYARCLFLGNWAALCTLLFAWLVLDIFLNGWEELVITDLSIHWLILISCFLSVFCFLPFSKLYAKYHSKRKTVQQFVTSNQKRLNQWHKKPFAITFLGAPVAVLLLVYTHWLGNWLDFQSTISTFGFRSLLAIPPVMPIVYIVMRFTMQEAREYLEEVSSSN